MSILNTKSGLNRLFPFAKKKPNIPAKLSDKIDTKTNKQKLVEDKNDSIVKSLEPIRCDVLTENNEKATPIQEKSCNDVCKKVFSETNKTISSQNDNSETKSEKKKPIKRKSSNVSEISIEEIKKPKENYQRWNIPFSSKFKGKDFDKTLLTMQDLIYYNPVTNPILKEPKVEQNEDDPDNDLAELPTVSDQKPSIPNNCITPCIKVGADGKIIIDQETLTLNETGLEEKREELAKSKVIEESAFNSRKYSYKRKKAPSKQWTKDETLKFYRCLMNLGTDFSMVVQYFPGRTRAQIKRKYKTEEKKNPELIHGALTNSTHYDSVLMENMFQEDEPINEVTAEVSTQPKTRKRPHKDIKRSECRKISVCAYMMEEEIELKNKREVPNKIITASNLKDKVLGLQAIKDKKKNSKKSKPVKMTDTEVNGTIVKSVKGKTKNGRQSNNDINAKSETDENEIKPLFKVRKLQDFHEEYEENISKYEVDSNSE